MFYIFTLLAKKIFFKTDHFCCRKRCSCSINLVFKSEHSAVWLAQLLWEQWVGGSNPSAPIYFNIR
jgi:hypothetical protein